MEKQTQKNGILRTEISGYLFSEALENPSTISDIKDMGGEIVIPKGKNDKIFIIFPEKNKKRMAEYLMVNNIKTIRTTKLVGGLKWW